MANHKWCTKHSQYAHDCTDCVRDSEIERLKAINNELVKSLEKYIEHFGDPGGGMLFHGRAVVELAKSEGAANPVRHETQKG